ncbi:MAG: hypothetical protein ACXQTH_04190, partial [Dehalococcoidia bacterium]
GDAESAEIMELKEREQFVWSLLQGDVIEKLGGMASAAILNAEQAQAELARRVSQKLGVDTELAERSLGELIARRALELEARGNGLRWQWSSTQKPKLTGDITAAIPCQA